MTDLEAIWRSAADDARLSADDRRNLARACLRDPGLEEELRFLVAHPSANLGGRFLRLFADELRHGGRRYSGASLVTALHETIRATPQAGVPPGQKGR
jgi:hypothetical protein